MKITREECDHLVMLYNNAQNTPIIAFTVQDGLEGNDLSSQAWRIVTEYQASLGKKYGYDPTKYAINTHTLEVIEV